MSITARAKNGLLRKFAGAADSRGYVPSPQDNLLPGIDFATVEDDLRGGDGDELGGKFCAIHSSCALAVNSFARFKTHPDGLVLLGRRGAKRVVFERKLPIFQGGTAPNMDVWIERDGDVVAVESKLLEYLTPKLAIFSKAYDRLAPPHCEACSWRAYEDAKEDSKRSRGRMHLDRAQLVKHYFGLNTYRRKAPQGPPLILLYIFWEPLNWGEVEECRLHRDELKAFADAVSGSQIAFRWTTYNDLWEDWSAHQNLGPLAQALRARYQVRV